jgi:hypothetical protein
MCAEGDWRRFLHLPGGSGIFFVRFRSTSLEQPPFDLFLLSAYYPRLASGVLNSCSGLKREVGAHRFMKVDAMPTLPPQR